MEVELWGCFLPSNMYIIHGIRGWRLSSGLHLVISCNIQVWVEFLQSADSFAGLCWRVAFLHYSGRYIIYVVLLRFQRNYCDCIGYSLMVKPSFIIHGLAFLISYSVQGIP